MARVEKGPLPVMVGAARYAVDHNPTLDMAARALAIGMADHRPDGEIRRLEARVADPDATLGFDEGRLLDAARLTVGLIYKAALEEAARRNPRRKQT